MKMKTDYDRIFLSPPDQTGLEEGFLKEVLKSNWIAPVGPQIEQFEAEICEKTGYDYAVALNSATSALHLSLNIHQIGKKDLVICSSLTFCASVNAILYTGADPVFVDSEASSWNMDLDLLETYLNSAPKIPKALIVTHIYGMPIDMVKLDYLSAKFEIVLIHNMAETVGGRFNNKKPGCYTGSGVVSFNGNKLITTGGGGAFLTNEKKQYEEVLYLSNQAKSNEDHYHHETVGYNYRLSNVLAAIGLAQMTQFDAKVIRKRQIYNNYKVAFSAIKGITYQEETQGSISDRWLSCILIDEEVYKKSTSEIIELFEAQNIEVRRTWKPMHLQPAYENYSCIGGEVSENIFNKGICLPSGTGMTNESQNRVIETLMSVLKKAPSTLQVSL